VEFGVFNALYVPKQLTAEWGPDAEFRRLRDEVEWTVAADRAGFKYCWATEHHFLTEYSHLSANETFLGYVAAKTERMHVGSGIMNITPPVNHPARVAERVAMLDLLSDGRFEFGMGRGSSTTEQRGFGIDDPELTREMFDEVVGQFKHMWRDGTYQFDGQYFSMPERNVLPKPHTKPHPPMWVAAGSPSTFQKAGEMGLGVLCFALAPPDSLAPHIEAYKEAISKCENPAGEYINDNVMVTSQLICLEDGNRAREIACNITAGYHDSLVFHYLDTFPKPAWVPEWPALIPEPTMETISGAIDRGMTCVGTPEEVAKNVERYRSIGADQLTFGMLSTTMALDVAIESVELFGKEVLPQFDIDPVHSTTRQRQAQLG